MPVPETGHILVLNAGSSSIKYAVFDGGLREQIAGQIPITTQGSGRTEGAVRPLPGQETRAPDHPAALARILHILTENALPLASLSAVAHRVVHGGPDLTEPTRLTPEILAQIRACAPLAPLHNPHNIRGMEIITDLAPNLPQFVSFDTAFHATNPDVASRYAVPDDWHKSNIRRFGFHGIAYQALVANFPTPLPEKLLAFHLGNGASACAIQGGKSVATTMGYSPLEGLTMGTRSGGIDAAAVLRMAERSSPAATLDTLNQRSGLAALSGGISDMKLLLATDTDAARFAVEHFCYWAARHAGSMIGAMGGIDAMAFSGGIGENAAPVRNRIAELLAWTDLPANAIHVIPAREERQIAANARACM